LTGDRPGALHAATRIARRPRRAREALAVGREALALRAWLRSAAPVDCTRFGRTDLVVSRLGLGTGRLAELTEHEACRRFRVLALPAPAEAWASFALRFAAFTPGVHAALVGALQSAARRGCRGARARPAAARRARGRGALGANTQRGGAASYERGVSTRAPKESACVPHLGARSLEA
jgi:hypothetical protein